MGNVKRESRQNGYVQPPKGVRSGQIGLFWFLAWYQERTGEPYTYKTQTELAEASGISQSTISRIVHDDKPKWLLVTDKAISLVDYDGKNDENDPEQNPQENSTVSELP